MMCDEDSEAWVTTQWQVTVTGHDCPAFHDSDHKYRFQTKQSDFKISSFHRFREFRLSDRNSTQFGPISTEAISIY